MFVKSLIFKINTKFLIFKIIKILSPEIDNSSVQFLKKLKSWNFSFRVSLFLKVCPREASVAHLGNFFKKVVDARMSTSVDVLRSDLGRLLVVGPRRAILIATNYPHPRSCSHIHTFSHTHIYLCLPIDCDSTTSVATARSAAFEIYWIKIASQRSFSNRLSLYAICIYCDYRLEKRLK